MPIQTTVKLTGIVPLCICGKHPKAYCTDGQTFHVECFPCRIFTVGLSNTNVAKAEFARIVRVVTEDRRKANESQLHSVR